MSRRSAASKTSSVFEDVATEANFSPTSSQASGATSTSCASMRGRRGERERERERETTEPLFPSDDDDDGEERVLRESEARFVSARGKRRVVRAFLFAALAGALFGYDIGSTAVVTSEDQILSDFDIPPNSWQQGALVSCSLYGALVASVLLFAFGEVLGRRQVSFFFFLNSFFSLQNEAAAFDQLSGEGERGKRFFKDLTLLSSHSQGDSVC